jgi:hypothetical protein
VSVPQAPAVITGDSLHTDPPLPHTHTHTHTHRT